MATLKNISHDTPNFSLLKTRWNFKEGNICAAKRFAFYSISLNSIALIVPMTLVFNREHCNSEAVHNDKIRPLAIDGPVRQIGVCPPPSSFGSQDFAETGLCHHSEACIEIA